MATPDVAPGAFPTRFITEMRSQSLLEQDRLLPGECVVIGVVQARNVIVADSCGTSDPYCTVVPISSKGKEVVAEKVKTEIIMKTLNPVWDELFVIGQVRCVMVLDTRRWLRA